jgi:transcription factor TFIIIB component B''
MSRGKVPTASANASIAKQAAAKSSSIPVQATTELPDQPVNAKDAGPPTTEKALPASQVNEDRRKAAEEQPTPETNKEPPVASTTKPTSTTRAESSAFTPQSSAKKNRKRKKLGVPVAASRLSIEEPLLSEVATPAAAGTDALDPSITAASPATESGQPSLASYCSSFRGKRTKRDKTAPPKKVTKETLPVIAQTDDSAAANQSDVATAPQVQVINGEIVLNESSIVVAGTTPAGSARDTEDLVVVEEEAQIAVVGASYNSFVSRRAPQHWTVEETELFYDALRQVGTDFGTMEAYFNKKRTRKQLKRKFQIESTKNPHLIEHALNPKAMKEIGMSNGCSKY